MLKAIYPKKRTYEKFDLEHYLLYLNEEPVEYKPNHGDMDGEEPESVQGFSYTGNMEDGSTKVKATEDTYDSFVSGLIRLKYSADQEAALQANMLEALKDKKHPRAAEFSERWEEFQAYREECKENAKRVLNL